MQKKFLLLLISTLILTEASIFDRIFSWGQKESTNAKDQFNKAKIEAYQSWQNAAKGASDLSQATWDKMFDTYESAWGKYEEVKAKIYQLAHESSESAYKDYQSAKSTLQDSTKKLSEFLSGYKDKAEEKTSDLFLSSWEPLEDAVSLALSKFTKARELLAELYDETYQECLDEYNAASEYLSHATDHLKNLAEAKSLKNYEESKKKLDEAKNKAREAYRKAKSKAEEAKSKLNSFNSEISEWVKNHYNDAREKSKDILELLNEYKNDAKAKTDSKYRHVLDKLQHANDKSARNLQEAELWANSIKIRMEKFAVDAMEAVSQKYQNLKDEL